MKKTIDMKNSTLLLRHAFILDVLCLLLCAVGLAGMWLAIFADVGVMVLAVLNSIRTLFVKKS